jgi:hypothetical protein
VESLGFTIVVVFTGNATRFRNATGVSGVEQIVVESVVLSVCD